MLLTLVIGLVVIVAIAIAMNTLRGMARVSFFGSSNDASSGRGHAFEPARDIPSQEGRVIIITGAAGDLGRQTAVELARYGRPARIYVADLPRDDAAKNALAKRITQEAYGGSQAAERSNDPVFPLTEIRFLDLDLSSLNSVRQAAAEFVAQEERLDILFLNAGILHVAPGTTSDGYEVHFGINYLGHALLSRLLIPTLLRTARKESQTDVRIVITSSEGHLVAPKNGIDFANLKTDCADMAYAKRYGQSKTALIGLAREISHKHPQVTVAAVHPGRILTGMAMSLRKESLLVRLTMPLAPLVCVPLSVGIRNHLWAATSRDVASGTYYEPVGVPGKLSPAAKDEDILKRLREWTDDALGEVELS